MPVRYKGNYSGNVTAPDCPMSIFSSFRPKRPRAKGASYSRETVLNTNIGFLYKKVDKDLQQKVEHTKSSPAKNQLLLTEYTPGLFGFDD